MTQCQFIQPNTRRLSLVDRSKPPAGIASGDNMACQAHPLSMKYPPPMLSRMAATEPSNAVNAAPVLPPPPTANALSP